MWTLQEYIGHPGYQYSPSGVPSMLFENTLDDTLQVAEITPLKPKMEKNINLYSGEPAWDDYVKYLAANGINPGKNNGKLKVVLSQITPLTEQYSNTYGPSELASGLESVTSGGLQELAFMNDFQGGKDLDKMAKEGGLGGSIAGLYQGVTNAAGNIVRKLTNDELGQDVKSMLQNPTQKIDIPQMWKGNSYTCSYQITIRLYCFDPLNDNHFTDLILAPMGALMMFAVPKSEQGKFYTWPFMLRFKIPGSCYVSLGYCQSLDIVKGGDVSDISWIKRSGTVDLRMVINSVYGVRTNSMGGLNQRPTVIQELKTMFGMEESKVKQFDNALDLSQVSNATGTSNDSGRTKEKTPEEEAAEAELQAKLEEMRENAQSQITTQD